MKTVLWTILLRLISAPAAAESPALVPPESFFGNPVKDLPQIYWLWLPEPRT